MPSLKTTFSWLLLGKVFSLSGMLLSISLVNRALGPDARGVLAEMQTWVAMFAVLVGLSLDTAIYHLADRERHKFDDIDFCSGVLHLSLFLSIVASLLMATIFWGAAHYVSNQSREHYVALAFLLLSTMLLANLLTMVQVRGKARLVALSGATIGVFSALFTLLAYLLGCLTLPFAVFLVSTPNFVAIVVILIAERKNIRLRLSVPMIFFSKLISVGLKQHLATISTFLYMKLNQLILFNYAGAEATGYYSVALNLAFSCGVLFAVLQSALYPRVIHHKDDAEITIRVMRVMIYGGGIFTLLLILSSSVLIRIYAGSGYKEAVSLFSILIIAVSILSLSSMMAPLFIKHGAFTQMVISAIILGGASVSLNLYLVPRYHAMGAAYATTLVAVMGFSMVLYIFWRISGKSPMPVFMPRFSGEWNYLKQFFLTKIARETS